MALAFVQESQSLVASSGSPLTATITFNAPIAAGSTLIIGISQAASGARTYTVSDNIHGSTGWTKAIGSAFTFQTEVWYRANHDGGTVTITVGHGQATVGFWVSGTEWSGFGSTVTVDASDSLEEAGTGTSHTCSTAGVTSTNDCVAFCAGTLSATATECNPGAGYTEVPTGIANNRVMIQYRQFASGCSGEVGAWSSTGTARLGRSVIALLRGPAGGGAPANNNNLLILGCG
jgi:hypothetical protein